MRTFVTKQPSNQDSVHQKPVRATPVPVARSLSTVLPGSAMLQRKPSCACGGGCPRCQEQTLLQTNLKISELGDRYEQEADLIADRVMRMPEPSVQRQMEPEEDEEEEMVQEKAALPTTNQTELSEAPPIVHEVLNSPGQPLDSETRTFMESRFGHDFSQVRVHTNGKAAESAQVVNSLAYTVGKDVVFRAGQYTPKTTRGQRLLAHELTHVVQQSKIQTHLIQQRTIDTSVEKVPSDCPQQTMYQCQPKCKDIEQVAGPVSSVDECIGALEREPAKSMQVPAAGCALCLTTNCPPQKMLGFSVPFSPEKALAICNKTLTDCCLSLVSKLGTPEPEKKTKTDTEKKRKRIQKEEKIDTEKKKKKKK
jgi:Domain of unknown function (DUF4157)